MTPAVRIGRHTIGHAGHGVSWIPSLRSRARHDLPPTRRLFCAPSS